MTNHTNVVGKCYSHIEIVTNLHILKLLAPHGRPWKVALRQQCLTDGLLSSSGNSRRKVSL